MRYRKSRRFRRRPNGRGHRLHNNGGENIGLNTTSFPNDRIRNNFNTYKSADKLAEKYNSLAKEAISSGEKTLAENYLQHADHFMRILAEQENFKLSKVNDNKKHDKIEVVLDNTNEQQESNKIVKT